jgi:hypothetical protein
MFALKPGVKSAAKRIDFVCASLLHVKVVELLRERRNDVLKRGP